MQRLFRYSSQQSLFKNSIRQFSWQQGNRNGAGVCTPSEEEEAARISSPRSTQASLCCCVILTAKNWGTSPAWQLNFLQRENKDQGVTSRNCFSRTMCCPGVPVANTEQGLSDLFLDFMRLERTQREDPLSRILEFPLRHLSRWGKSFYFGERGCQQGPSARATLKSRAPLMVEWSRRQNPTVGVNSSLSDCILLRWECWENKKELAAAPAPFPSPILKYLCLRNPQIWGVQASTLIPWAGPLLLSLLSTWLLLSPGHTYGENSLRERNKGRNPKPQQKERG